MDNINDILMDYYDGAYGPTIRIDIKTVVSLNTIKNLFDQLSDSAIREVNLAEIDGVKNIGDIELLLKVLPDNIVRRKKLRYVSDAATRTFELAMSSKEWKIAAGLIDGLLNFNRPGHQYLTQEGIDDAIIELAFME